MYSRLTIFNMALALVPQTRVASTDERSLAAQECSFHYPLCLNLLLGDWPWKFATVRTPLTLLLNNDRSAEWAFAYALPADMRYPAKIAPWGNEATGGATSWNWPMLNASQGIATYAIAGQVVYTNWPDAVLEYVSTEQIEARFTAEFAEALATELATKIVLPLSQNESRQEKLVKAATATLDRAKEADAAQQPEFYSVSSEIDAVRNGALIWTPIIGPRG